MLDQTDNRYLNGIGSDLDRMRYLMDNAAVAQQSLGLQLEIKPPRVDGELPTIIHARYLGSH
ncbi:hypothetical protein [Enterobacter ludwigii]|uniref:hypothetical protein n=1 Tax=Enterobacter ludwigii TaxID=299767 RepID=UPI0024319613|nr:hypothetical protein [Enterobacter ludwigii]WGC25004.1 hypothetical protein NFL62_00345 [Enterobacter ludwigii]